MKPTRYFVALALGLTAILTCLTLYSGTTRFGPFLGQGPYDVQVGAIILVCIAATAAIGWSIYAIFHGSDGATSRQALQSAALTSVLVILLLMMTVAVRGGFSAVAAGLTAVLMILASLSALRCIDALSQGRAIGFESHWGGLGGGSGGWRILPTTALALISLTFTGAAIALAFAHADPSSAPPAPNAAASPTPTPSATSTGAASGAAAARRDSRSSAGKLPSPPQPTPSGTPTSGPTTGTAAR